MYFRCLMNSHQLWQQIQYTSNVLDRGTCRQNGFRFESVSRAASRRNIPKLGLHLRQAPPTQSYRNTGHHANCVLKFWKKIPSEASCYMAIATLSIVFYEPTSYSHVNPTTPTPNNLSCNVQANSLHQPVHKDHIKNVMRPFFLQNPSLTMLVLVPRLTPPLMSWWLLLNVWGSCPPDRSVRKE